MKPSCRKIQKTLATEGPRALRHDELAQQHLAECDACFRFLESLTEIEDGLQAMARLDAPDEVVESLLSRPEIAAGAIPEVEPSRWQGIVAAAAKLLRPRPLVWGSVAAAFLIVALAVGLRSMGPDLEQVVQEATLDNRDEAGRLGQELPEKQRQLDPGNLERLQSRGRLSGGDDAKRETPLLRKVPVPDPRPPAEQRSEPGKKDGRHRRRANLHDRSAREKSGTGQDSQGIGAGAVADKEKSMQFPDHIADLPVPGRFHANVPTPAPGVQDPDGEAQSTVRGSRSRDFDAVVGGVTGHKDDGEKSRIVESSVEEMEVITSGAVVELDRASGGFADLDETIRPQSESERKAVRRPPPPPAPLPPTAGVTAPVLIEASRVAPEFPELARVARVEARVVLRVLVRADGSVAGAEVVDSNRPDLGFEQAAIEAVEQWRYEPARRDGRPVDVHLTIVVDFKLGGTGDPEPADPDTSLLRPDDALGAARAFLDERGSIEGVTFMTASGYWSNSYVPGDPAMRLLQSRLAGWDRSAMQVYLPSAPRLHDAARRVGQPFDTPAGSALAVYLQADRRGLAEPGRMLVQVGLEGTPRHGGRRGAMNVALVLDLREEIPPDVAIALRSLLEAFNRAKEPGDRFRIFAAGRPGGCVVETGDFRHGFLKVTLDRLLAAPQGGPGLAGAVSAAIESVAAVDDPQAPLGSNAVMLVTSGPLGDATRTLADLAHQGALAGVPLSVIGVGDEVALDEIDLVALAGQGNRRLLDEPAAAAELVERELSAASRAVARAVRLRIRLAPGVRLVEVIGSERLDAARAQRVRQAERSIDLRLARRLGIEADRGADEEGIQIVVPSFYAGDAHVVLLDVVAPGPGPIADVTVRYKDLVHLKNNVARASLALGRDERPAGPLERNVLANLLSLRLSRALDEAGRALKSGDAPRAASLLHDFAALLEGLRRELPGLANDPVVLDDIAMLAEYRTLLASGFAGQPERRSYLADSLRYAARLKVLPRPLETTS